MQAYGFNPDDDLLEKLLSLNLELAAKEKRGEPVVGPWHLKKREARLIGAIVYKLDRLTAQDHANKQINQ